jgi:hypothetical protein
MGLGKNKDKKQITLNSDLNTIKILPSFGLDPQHQT